MLGSTPEAIAACFLRLFGGLGGLFGGVLDEQAAIAGAAGPVALPTLIGIRSLAPSRLAR